MIGEKLIKWANERFPGQKENRNGLVANVTEELGEWLQACDQDDAHEKIDSLADISVFVQVEMAKMGYHPDKVLEETYKEINSRTGAWSEKDQKWKKFKTPEAVAKWVKADYSKCKI